MHKKSYRLIRTFLPSGFILVLLLANQTVSAQCLPLITPGVICCDQQICPGESISLIAENEFPLPGADSFQLYYRWRNLVTDTTTGALLWRLIPGANNRTYQPTELPYPPAAPNIGYFVREVRRENCTEWLTSNLVQIRLLSQEDCENSAAHTIEPLDRQFRVFPNPSSDWLWLQNDAQTPSEVGILTLDGRLLARETLGSGQTLSFSVAEWPAGVYLIRVERSESREIFLRHWVKN